MRIKVNNPTRAEESYRRMVLRPKNDSSVPVVAVAVGTVTGIMAALVLFCIVWKVCSKKKRKSNSYEKIATQSPTTYFTVDSCPTPVSMKQIPFTVPTHGTPTSSRRGERLYSDTTSTGGLSEPTSPNTKRPSVEIPGAYALGSIDPSLYKIADEDDDYEIPPGHIGRVWFAVEYERETEKLQVTLIKAKNLPSRQFGNTTACDPFARIYLMPDERRYLQSKFKKKTCNPKFEESYVFQVSFRALEDRTLKFSVFDVDRHKRHNIIGHALYQLKEHETETNDRLVVWRDLEREVAESTADRGELMLSLTYNNHLERLNVGIFDGRDLKTDSGPSTDTYVKVCMQVQNKILKSKKTEAIRKTDCPNYNESFTFKLPVINLDTASLSITAMQSSSGKDKVIGRVILGSFMFARGKELDHWNEMVANQKEQVTHWHSLV